MRSVGLCTLVLCATAPDLEAQRQREGSLRGRVLAEGMLTPIAHAELMIPVADLRATGDERGAFDFRHIPVGKHFLEVRAIGRLPLRLVIDIPDTGRVERDFVLRAVSTLDTVNVVASAVIPSFEEHRAVGLGQFLTRAELEKMTGRKLGDLLGQFRGVKVIRGNVGAAWLTSSRGPKSMSGRGSAIDNASLRRGAKAGECYSQVYLDAMLIYKSSRNTEEDLFDLNSVAAEQIEAIEYYAGPASTPLRYSRLNTECGVLVIHTRRFSADSAKKKP